MMQASYIVFLNGQSPYFNNSMAASGEQSDEELKQRIAETLEIAKVNELVYNAEMVNHRIFGQKQENTANRVFKRR